MPIQKVPGPIQKAPEVLPPINMAVISFSLMEANTRKVLIETIDDGSVIDISALGTRNLGIRANTVGTTPIQSIRFELNGNNDFKTENSTPWSLTGDENGNFSPWLYELGKQNTLKATPFTAKGGSGREGAYREIRFTIVQTTA